MSYASFYFVFFIQFIRRVQIRVYIRKISYVSPGKSPVGDLDEGAGGNIENTDEDAGQGGSSQPHLDLNL